MKLTVSWSELPSYYNNEHKNAVLVSSIILMHTRKQMPSQLSNRAPQRLWSHTIWKIVWEKASIKVLAEDGNVSIIHLEFTKKTHSVLNHVKFCFQLDKNLPKNVNLSASSFPCQSDLETQWRELDSVKLHRYHHARLGKKLNEKVWEKATAEVFTESRNTSLPYEVTCKPMPWNALCAWIQPQHNVTHSLIG